MSEQYILHVQSEAVAIIGMACRYAGGVRDPPGLWKLLRDKRDAWLRFDNVRGFSTKGFHHPNHERPGSMTTAGGYLLDEDPRLFDHTFFGITGREVETMDPSQRKLLEVVYEAFENGGETWDSISGSRTGVYVGNFALDHLLMQSRDWENPKPYSATGADSSILANRISYIFNLHGPSLVTTTACSSSMYALHLAVQAIRNGECDSAIVAASNCILDPTMQMVLDKLGALSPTSRCHTFDASADGYARGEGYAALYLRKSSIAALDGSPIRAVIRGTAVNANGRTGGIARPQVDGQEAVIRKAYENAGNLPFSDTTYFECHGTGTQAGDPIEVSAVGNVFASSRSDAPEDRLLIGAIKTNLGHTEGASAIASVIKVVLSLEAGEIPPSYGIETLNPNIDFDKAKVEVIKDDTISWPKGKLRRASVNSFGFGGANGHCIIDHVNVVLPHYVKPGIPHGPSSNGLNGHNSNRSNGRHNGSIVSAALMHSPILEYPEKDMRADAVTRQLVLLPFSAHNTSSLRLNINALSKVIGQRSLADVAYTLASKRSKLQHRSFRIVKNDDAAKGLIEDDRRIFASPVQTTNIGFVFTGQGAQWHGMGMQLFEYAVFRNTISYLDQVVGALDSQRSWTIQDVLAGNCEEGRIELSDVSQTACTAVQIGLVDLLASWSVRPSAVAGHSSGEMAAAYASGYTTAAEAITAAYLRGQAVSKNKQKGAMLAVGLSLEQVSSFYPKGREHSINIASINSPSSVTVSGDEDAIEALSTALTKGGIFNRLLRTGGNAYHSHHMIPLGSDYVKMLTGGFERINKLGLDDRRQRYSHVRWVSSVTPDKAINEEDVKPSYWRANLESPVRFSEAVRTMLSSEVCPLDVLIEIGPHASLKSPVNQISESIDKDVAHIPSLKRGEDARESMLQLAGSLFGFNAKIDLVAVNAVDNHHAQGTQLSLSHGCTAVDLPPYQYEYGPVKYYESRSSKEFRLRKVLRHDLLGVRVPGVAKLQPQWRNVLNARNLPWLSDHCLLSDTCFPVTGFMAMAIEAASQVYREFPDALAITGYSIHDMDIKSGLLIPDDDCGIEVIFSMTSIGTVTATSPAWARFAISSVEPDSEVWKEHCTGLVKVEVSEPARISKLDTETMDSRFPDPRSWYRQFRTMGLGHGPTFQTLLELQTDPNQKTATARVALKTTDGIVPGGESRYPLHPTALDGTIQLGLIACYGGQVEGAKTAFVPLRIGQLYLKTGFDQEWGTAIAQSKMQGLKGANTRLQLLSMTGDVVLDVDKLSYIRHSSSRSADSPRLKAFSSPFTRLVWKPDFNALTNQQVRGLFPPPGENMRRIVPLERADMIVCLVVAEIYDTLVRSGNDGLQPSGELGHWMSWVRRTVKEDKRENMVEARELSPDRRRQLLERLYDEAGDDPETKAAKIVHENIEDILHGRKTGLEVLVPNGLLTDMYQEGHMLVGAYPQLFNVMDCLGHANPNLRILEVGAGTGGATRVVMKALAARNGIKRYSDYTFTDISAGFLTSAQYSMHEFRDMNFSVLDIELDPLEQGYQPVYDVIIASQSIHATVSMNRTLANCRRLLKPGGKLVLVESTRMRVLPGLLYGIMTGYWLGINDDRSEGPFMNLQTWDSRLREAGFSGTELHLDDYPEPHNTTSVIVSTLETENQNERTNGAGGKGEEVVHLLYGEKGVPPLLDHVAQRLVHCGVTPKISPLDATLDAISANSRIMAFLDGENLLLDLDQHRLEIFQHLARSAKTMVWLTSTGIIKGRNPDGALVIGLLRTIGTENPASQFVSIDIDADSFEIQGDALSHAIVHHEMALQNRRATVDDIQDREFAWQDGCMWVSRVVPDERLEVYAQMPKTLKSCDSDMLPLGTQGPLSAAFETPGIFGSLYFQPSSEACQPLPRDYIEVKVDVIGLRPEDIDILSGKLNSNGSNHLLCEYAGVVMRTGAEVTGMFPGDRVYGIGGGYIGNYIRVSAAFAQRLGPEDDPVEATTMPCAYMTAVYALDHLARVRKGQKVLIQSATGALGLAAIQLARLRSAEVFATADTPEGARFLIDSVAIPSSHILSLGHPATPVADTFNIIINTATGDSLDKSLKVLEPMGHLIDLSRQETLASTEMSLELFRRNASFSSFDLSLIIDSDLELGEQLMKTVDKLHHAGHISPLHPIRTTDVSDIGQALLDLSKGTNIGKTVVTFQNPNSLMKVLRAPPAVRFDPKASYIITGGFGGLGRSIIRWMTDRGARDFLILSRRGASTPEARSMTNTLEASGVRLRAAACDISDRDRVVAAVQEASSGRPVKGVIHAALSLSDVSFDKLTIDKWRDGIAAKVKGTRNLHEATAGLQLDFFIMTTSTESIWAPPTQSVYMAASNFQDVFARYRRRLGLPASTIAFGLVNDVGSDWRNGSSGTAAMYERNKALTITENMVLASLETAFLKDDDDITAGIKEKYDASQGIGHCQRQDLLSAANIFTCLDPATMAAKQQEEIAAGTASTSIPRWYSDGRVSLIIRALNDAQRSLDGSGETRDTESRGSKSAVARLRREFDEAAKAAKAVPGDRAKTIEFVTDAITKAMAEMLFIEVLSVNPYNSVAAHGVDSLIAAELRNWFHQALGANVSTLKLLDADQSIRNLAADIVEKALEV